jgi:hypothetical protein
MRKEVFAVTFKFIGFAFDESLHDKLLERLSLNVKSSFRMLDPVYVTKELVDEPSV